MIQAVQFIKFKKKTEECGTDSHKIFVTVCHHHLAQQTIHYSAPDMRRQTVAQIFDAKSGTTHESLSQ